MFQSLKVVGVCAVLLGVEYSDAMQIEKQGQSNSPQKIEVEIALPEIESSELIGNIENPQESPTEENQAENIEQEEVKPEESIQNSSEIEEAISENATEDPTDTGVVLSDTEEIIQHPENSAEETDPVENIPTESISEPENVNLIEEVQNPEENAPAEFITEPENVNPIEGNQNSEELTQGEVDSGEPNTTPEIVNPIDDQIPTGSTTEVEETISSTEEENHEGSVTEIDEIDSGIESGSESEHGETISVRIVKILTVIKDKSVEFLRRIFNIFF